jgi:two-component system sensor histidine kinase UhpB
MRRRDWIIGALLVAIVAEVAVAWDRNDAYSGVNLAYRDGQVVVASVDYGSSAYAQAVPPDWVVETIGDGNELTDVLGETVAQKQALAAAPWQWRQLNLIPPGDVAAELKVRADSQGPADSQQCLDVRYVDSGYICVISSNVAQSWFWFGQSGGQGEYFLLWTILLGTLLGAWWLRSGREGQRLVPYAWTLPVAVAMPLLVMRLDQIQDVAVVVVQGGMLVAGGLPLGLQLVGGLQKCRRTVGAIVVLAAIATMGVSVLMPIYDRAADAWMLPLLRVLCPAAIVLVPGLARAVQALRLAESGAQVPAGEPRAIELAAVALTAASSCAGLLLFPHETWLVLVWLGAIAVWRLGRLPMSKLLSRASFQRDLAVRATEVERARIAADIHDYALQDLTMLVRRLDAAGDSANAAAAREVAERLRSICGDLRLPVLDDLGVGPAIEWLCQRYEEPAGPVALDRLEDERRLPTEPELAFFRVAQEAISNAVRHGAPPISVRYRGGGTWAELEVDDSGSGVPASAAETAERSGHLGLMSMRQRAESIAADLNVGRRPGGGTRVSMVWDPGVRPEGAAGEGGGLVAGTRTMVAAVRKPFRIRRGVGASSEEAK